jgi:hypothetical protein
MTRSKEDIEAERELAVGLVIGCALDVKKSNAADLIQGVAQLEKLLAAVQRLAQVFGWPDDPRAEDDDAKRANTRH